MNHEDQLIQRMLQSVSTGADAVLHDLLEAPDEDWVPILVAIGADETLNIVGVPGELLDTDASKTLLADILIPAIAEECGAQALCLMVGAWMRQGPGELEEVRALEPTEALSVVAVTRTRTVHRLGRVTRRGDSVPVLEWEDPVYDAEVGGRFPDAMRRALQGVPA
jgi:hypothetical protein